MLAPYLARIVWRLRNRHTPETQPPPLSPGAAALAIGYLCYVANFALVGFGLWIVASVLVPGTAISPILLTGAFASKSEEHTSELQSLMRISYAVFCLKKK